MALGLVLFAGATAHAGPNYRYDWSTLSGSDIVINAQGTVSYPPQYKLTVKNEPLSPVLNVGTDTVASRLIVDKLFDSPQPDNIVASFNLKLVVYDQDNGLNNLADPVIYHATMNTTVTGAGVTTNSVTLTPMTPTTFTLGNHEFKVTLPATGMWFTPPPNLGAQNPGTIGLHIDAKDNGGGGVNPTPEPSTMLLGCLGMSFAGLAAWRKRRNAVEA